MKQVDSTTRCLALLVLAACGCDLQGEPESGNLDVIPRDGSFNDGNVVAPGDGGDADGGCEDECRVDDDGCIDAVTPWICRDADGDSCLEQDQQEPCPRRFACTAGRCAEACQDACTGVGEITCVQSGSREYRECAEAGEYGCYEMVAGQCERGYCDAGKCSCDDRCEEGERGCDGDEPWECVPDAAGCLSVKTAPPCRNGSNGDNCVEGACRCGTGKACDSPLFCLNANCYCGDLEGAYQECAAGETCANSAAEGEDESYECQCGPVTGSQDADIAWNEKPCRIRDNGSDCPRCVTGTRCVDIGGNSMACRCDEAEAENCATYGACDTDTGKCECLRTGNLCEYLTSNGCDGDDECSCGDQGVCPGSQICADDSRQGECGCGAGGVNVCGFNPPDEPKSSDCDGSTCVCGDESFECPGEMFCDREQAAPVCKCSASICDDLTIADDCDADGSKCICTNLETRACPRPADLLPLPSVTREYMVCWGGDCRCGAVACNAEAKAGTANLCNPGSAVTPCVCGACAAACTGGKTCCGATCCDTCPDTNCDVCP